MDVLEIIGRIDFLKKQIDELRPISPEILNRINRKFRFDWDYHSSNIEGNSLTYGETKAFLLHGLTAGGKPFRDHLEIRGHNEAVFELEDIVKNEKPVSETAIKQLHQIVLGSEPYEIEAPTANGQMTRRTIYPGKYKSQPNHVITVTGERFDFASPEDTAPKMQELVEWLRNELLKNELHPLIIAATLHHKFIMIHPFDDGNGRIARLLMNLVLMIKGFPPAIILTQDKENYLRALRQADAGEIEGFIIYIGEQLIRSLELFLKGAYGENIEDLDEVDKKIALFKAKLKKPEEGIKHLKRSREAITEVVESSLIPLLKSLVDKLQHFDELFFDRSIEIEIQEELPEPEKEVELNRLIPALGLAELQRRKVKITCNNFKEVILYLRSEIFKASFIRFTYYWKSYKENPANSFDEKCYVDIKLEVYKYTIFGSENAHYFEIPKFYHQQLNPEEIRSCTQHLAEEVIERMQRRLKL